MGYYAQLIEFLKQAKTNDLKTKHFEGKYKNCKVKVSFGQGQAARIPWISFLKEPNTTSNGIYPVYLYYKDFEKLILAYGLSETNLPQFSWPITNSVTIKKYFKEEGLGVPDRYGESFICKVYNASNLPDERRVEEDLDKILEVYDSLNFEEQSGSNIRTTIPFKAQSFLSVLSDSGLQYTSMLVIRFIASLITKPFVILTGLSGSGKTKLAQAFAQWLCEDKSQYCIVPVGADWTNREPLLALMP